MARTAAKKARDKIKRREEHIAWLKDAPAREAALNVLKAQGRSCGNCEHVSQWPGGKWGCDLRSDFHGFTPVKLSHVCSSHAFKASPTPTKSEEKDIE